MAVIGLTCRIDAISLFEKRVRSRFSHRQIYLLAKPDWGRYVETFGSLLRMQATRGLKTIYVRSWNKSIDDLVQDPLVQGTLKKLFNFNPKLRLLHNIMVRDTSYSCIYILLIYRYTVFIEFVTNDFITNLSCRNKAGRGIPIEWKSPFPLVQGHSECLWISNHRLQNIAAAGLIRPRTTAGK